MKPQTDDFDAYIRARDENGCQYHYEGCTGGCDVIQLRLPPHQLEFLRRDPNSPDNWCCVCLSCASQTATVTQAGS